MSKSTEVKSNALEQVIETVHRLRAPGGCPWDRAQTHQSLRQYLIEEAYEVIDLLDQLATSEDIRKPKLQSELREELGDLLMQILLHSEMAWEQGAFSIYDVAATLNEKLIRRHPHVFGELKADSPASALKNWEREKAKEKEKDKNPDVSILDGLPKGLPTLQRTARVLEKVSRVGFQWNELKSPLAKVDEELAELKQSVIAYDEAQAAPQALHQAPQKEKLIHQIESEMGDFIFSLCNIAYLLKISPEDALRTMLLRFERRFRYVEKKIKELGKRMEDCSLAEMDVYWNESKLDDTRTL